MERQGSFTQAEYAGKKKQTRRDKFLAEMEQVVPWARLVERLRPFYPKGERGGPPVGLERMLRIYLKTAPSWRRAGRRVPAFSYGGGKPVEECSPRLLHRHKNNMSDGQHRDDIGHDQQIGG